MFIRAKKNQSGTVSVQVIDKSSGSYKVVKSMGSSLDQDEIKRLKVQARDFIMKFQGQQSLAFITPTDRHAVKCEK
ncbi:hypothetical protein [Belliella aquatica]|uniref:Uncharacterized protein n=1 Tax=Belliella aquatica TaxID=1323734 RepID=A0ABQ1MBG7_9BACT|nr:hypothetical protein [Belliella aquatica]MCH7405675.1 hypothetical protein [Belliella aquatica]GGC36900.1 hypothetical protein GCM10010993_14670 [Belliella aquatica]